MNEITCPFLGLKDDPANALPFPSKENLCYHARPIQPARGTYQYQYCLTAEHTACPLFQAATPIPMPENMASPFSAGNRKRRVLALVGIPLLITAVALFSFVWKAYGSRLLAAGSIPGTGQISFPNAGSTNSLNVAPTRLAASSNSALLLAQRTQINCPLPSGWSIYTVNQTDSIFRLSAVYGISLGELQKANCMGKSTVILPGQVIYVPNISTVVAPIDLAVIPPQTFSPSQTYPTSVSLTPPAPTFQPNLYGPPTPVPQQPAATATPPPPAAVPPSPSTSTNTSVPSSTITSLPSNTPIKPTNTGTSVPSNTSVPATPTATNNPTATPRPTNTPKPSRTPKLPATSTPQPTSTPPPPTATLAPPPPTATLAPPPPTATQAPPPPTDTQAPPPPTDTQAPPPPPAPTDTTPLPTIQPALPPL